MCEPFKSYFRGFEVYERVLKLPDVNAEILFYVFFRNGRCFRFDTALYAPIFICENTNFEPIFNIFPYLAHVIEITSIV